MNITQWLDGRVTGRFSIETCRQVAQVLKRLGFQVLELYEIQTLVIFSPSYGEISQRGK